MPDETRRRKTLPDNPLDRLLAPPATEDDGPPVPQPAASASSRPAADPAAPDGPPAPDRAIPGRAAPDRPSPTPAGPRPASPAQPVPVVRSAPEPGQYLTFRLAGTRFAAAILQVREILELGVVTRVPRTPDWVFGVMNLRGSVVPVVDLAARLGLPPCRPGRRTCIVVADVGPGEDGGVAGLLVDRVEEVLDVGPGEVQPPPDFGTAVHPAYLEGLASTGDGLALVVDLAGILDETAPAAAELLAAASPDDPGDGTGARGDGGKDRDRPTETPAGTAGAAAGGEPPPHGEVDHAPAGDSPNGATASGTTASGTTASGATSP